MSLNEINVIAKRTVERVANTTTVQTSKDLGDFFQTLDLRKHVATNTAFSNIPYEPHLKLCDAIITKHKELNSWESNPITPGMFGYDKYMELIDIIMKNIIFEQILISMMVSRYNDFFKYWKINRPWEGNLGYEKPFKAFDDNLQDSRDQHNLQLFCKTLIKSYRIVLNKQNCDFTQEIVDKYEKIYWKEKTYLQWIKDIYSINNINNILDTNTFIGCMYCYIIGAILDIYRENITNHKIIKKMVDLVWSTKYLKMLLKDAEFKLPDYVNGNESLIPNILIDDIMSSIDKVEDMYDQDLYSKIKTLTTQLSPRNRQPIKEFN